MYDRESFLSQYIPTGYDLHNLKAGVAVTKKIDDIKYGMNFFNKDGSNLNIDKYARSKLLDIAY